MSLYHITIFSTAGLLNAFPFVQKHRHWLVFAISVITLYWLQPVPSIHDLGFWLPTASLVLVGLCWVLTAQSPIHKRDWTAVGMLSMIMLGIALTRYLPAGYRFSTARPPQTWQILLAAMVIGLIAMIIFHIRIKRSWIYCSAIGIVLLLFCILKSPTLSHNASCFLRRLNGQDPALASALDIRWLGFSYIAFRLLHVLRDRMAGRLLEVTLDEFLSYTLFFPALTAGPIDRIQHFTDQLRTTFTLTSETLLSAGVRIVSGIFMKFVLADGLALLSLSPQNSLMVQSTPWMWLLTYAYSFRILFDFAGYTSIAIGIGMLFGVTLPENFARPYRQKNITAFWNSWHITLAQWFRAYYFNPLSRMMRQKKIPACLIIFTAQISTMMLIGLWHGITWNFLLWGLWHGLGLFAHNRWAEFRKGYTPLLPHRFGQIISTVFTFHFVLLGWVWFALPNLAHSLQVFRVLFGGGG